MLGPVFKPDTIPRQQLFCTALREPTDDDRPCRSTRRTVRENDPLFPETDRLARTPGCLFRATSGAVRFAFRRFRDAFPIVRESHPVKSDPDRGFRDAFRPVRDAFPVVREASPIFPDLFQARRVLAWRSLGRDDARFGGTDLRINSAACPEPLLVVGELWQRGGARPSGRITVLLR